MFEAEFWVAVAFVLLLVLLGYFGVHKTLIQTLDQRRDRIKNELDEAKRLKNEAAALLAEYKKKRETAEREAQGIVDAARAEAERLAADGKAKLEEFVARRTQMAETKIAQAEAQALADVRAAAADAAVAAAGNILSSTVTGQAAENLVSQGISEVRQKLN